MPRFDLFILRPCGTDATTRHWQVVHRQSGARTIAPDTAAATAWLAGQAGTGGARPSAEAPTRVRWAAGAAVALRLGLDSAQATTECRSGR